MVFTGCTLVGNSLLPTKTVNCNVDLGQLEGYVAACDLSLNGQGENPAVGLVICKGKNEILVRYLLGKTDMPIGVTDYEVANCWPEDFKSDLPTVAEIEAELDALNAPEPPKDDK